MITVSKIVDTRTSMVLIPRLADRIDRDRLPVCLVEKGIPCDREQVAGFLPQEHGTSDNIKFVAFKD
jgi:hypothetical protein